MPGDSVCAAFRVQRLLAMSTEAYWDARLWEIAASGDNFVIGRAGWRVSFD